MSFDEGRTFGPIQQAATPDGGWARSPVLASGPDGFWLAWPTIYLAGSARDDVHMLASHLPYGASSLEPPIMLDDGTRQVRYGPSIVELDSKMSLSGPTPGATRTTTSIVKSNDTSTFTTTKGATLWLNA